MKVYKLSKETLTNDGEDDIETVGIFTTREKALECQERHTGKLKKNSFGDYTNRWNEIISFFLDEYELDEDYS